MDYRKYREPLLQEFLTITTSDEYRATPKRAPTYEEIIDVARFLVSHEVFSKIYRNHSTAGTEEGKTSAAIIRHHVAKNYPEFRTDHRIRVAVKIAVRFIQNKTDNIDSDDSHFLVSEYDRRGF